MVFLKAVPCCRRVKRDSTRILNVSGCSMNSKAASSQILSIAEREFNSSNSLMRFGHKLKPLQSVTKVERIVPIVRCIKEDFEDANSFIIGPLMISLTKISTLTCSKQSTEARNLFFKRRPAKPRAGSLPSSSNTKI